MASRNFSASKKKFETGSTGPLLDYQGNVLPPPGSEDKYCKPSPIPRLAAVEDLSRPIPTAGCYGIEHVKPYELSIPPESYLYDGDRPWVLGKLNKVALDIQEPAEPLILSKELQEKLNKMEAAANADLAKTRGLEVPVTGIDANANSAGGKKVKSKSASGSPVWRTSGATRTISQAHQLKRRTSKSKSKSPGRSGDAPGSPSPKLVTIPRTTFSTKKVVNPKRENLNDTINADVE